MLPMREERHINDFFIYIFFSIFIYISFQVVTAWHVNLLGYKLRRLAATANDICLNASE